MSPDYQVSLVSGKLICRSNLTNEVIWEGKPHKMSVTTILAIPESEDVIVLLDYKEAWRKKKKNLLRISPVGNVVWEVGVTNRNVLFGEEREEIESYTGLNGIEGLSVRAFTFSGFSDQINIETGEVIKSVFVK
jgi:hypothetical protein